MAETPQWSQNLWHGPADNPGAALNGAPFVAPGAPGSTWAPPVPPQSAPGVQGAYQASPGQPPVPPAPAPKKRGWIVALVAVILFFLFLFVAMFSCVGMVNSSFGSLGGGTSSSVPYTSGNTVAIITIDGTIQYDGSTSSPEGLSAKLDIAAASPDIKAVVLRVNSGGGTATAGEEMAIYVKDFPKPIVVSSASTNCSAAYEISSQADYIFADETSAIGAIGTIMQTTDISQLLDKLGIQIDNISSTESKESSFGVRPLSEEERAHYQAMVDQINGIFVAKVAEGRHMTVEDVQALATGLPYTGIDGVENGLIDAIGTLDDAVAKACELAGIGSADVIYLRDERSDLSFMMDLLGSSSSSSTTDLKETSLYALQ